MENKLFDKPLSIVLDSDYISLNLRWLKEEKYDLISKDLKNSQLFGKIYKIINHYKIKYILTTIKSHTNNSLEMYRMNNKVDQMANSGLKNLFF